jgi:hypothetical protein
MSRTDEDIGCGCITLRRILQDGSLDPRAICRMGNRYENTIAEKLLQHPQDGHGAWINVPKRRRAYLSREAFEAEQTFAIETSTSHNWTHKHSPGAARASGKKLLADCSRAPSPPRLVAVLIAVKRRDGWEQLTRTCGARARSSRPIDPLRQLFFQSIDNPLPVTLLM